MSTAMLKNATSANSIEKISLIAYRQSRSYVKSKYYYQLLLRFHNYWLGGVSVGVGSGVSGALGSISGGV